MTTRVEWFPPDGSDPIVFQDPGDFRLLRFDGSFSTKTSALLRKSAGQIGATFTDRISSQRSVSLQCIVESTDLETFYVDIGTLIKSLAGVPGNTEIPNIGTLRVHRPGRPTVETEAEPTDSPREAMRHNARSATIDIEWTCPSSLWFEIQQQTITLKPVAENPWVSPWFSPWFSPAAQSSGTAINSGDVPVGIIARFFGPQNTVRLINSRTGEQLQVFVNLASGDVLDVDTEARTVTLNGTSVLESWDFNGTWWKLLPDEQTVITEANSAESTARTVVIWQSARAGI